MGCIYVKLSREGSRSKRDHPLSKVLKMAEMTAGASAPFDLIFTGRVQNAQDGHVLVCAGVCPQKQVSLSPGRHKNIVSCARSSIQRLSCKKFYAHRSLAKCRSSAMCGGSTSTISCSTFFSNPRNVT